MNYSDTTLIIPTLNEAENISKIIDNVENLYPKINFIISDDGSNDGTQEIVIKRAYKNHKIKLLDRSKETVHGLTASIVHASKTVKTKYIVVIDGDMQHPPEKIEEIVYYLRKGVDIVVGTREKDLSEWNLHRKIISKFAITLGRLRLSLNGIYCKDILSGFFGIKTNLIKNILKNWEDKFQPEGYKILFDILKHVKNDIKIKEVSYLFGLRENGRSKLNKKHMFLYFKSLFQ